jgi:hypothetical protein
MGVKSTPALKALGYVASAPGRGLGKMLSPILGGDPGKAAKDIYEGMRGANVMGNFGRIGEVSAGEAKNVLNSFNKSFFKHASEKLVGGAGDNKPDKRYPREELAKGVKHESEHVSDKGIAKEIAKDHLEENRSYYSTLDKYKIGCLKSAFEFLK